MWHSQISRISLETGEVASASDHHATEHVIGEMRCNTCSACPNVTLGTRRGVGGQPTHVIGVQMRKQHGVNVIDADIQLVQLTHRAASGDRPWRADEVFGMISPQ